MLNHFCGGFVNFAVVNSRFLSPRLNCKLPHPGQNPGFAFPPARLQTQTDRHSKTRISRWQNTIFGFLTAQLDFLAIFASPP